MAYIALVIVLTLWIFALPPVHAQKDTEEQVSEIVGPYEIGVVTNPLTPTFGDVHFTITVLNASTRQPVPEAQVLIHTRSEADGTEGWALALNISRVPERYEATVKLGVPGTWTVNVEVASAIGVVLVEVLPLEVREPTGSTAGGLVFVGVSLVFVLGGMYVWWSVRRLRKRAAQSRRESDHREQCP